MPIPIMSMANRFKKDFFLHPFDWRYDVNLDGEVRLRKVPYKPMWSFTPQEQEYVRFYEQWCRNPEQVTVKKPDPPAPRWLAEGVPYTPARSLTPHEFDYAKTHDEIRPEEINDAAEGVSDIAEGVSDITSCEPDSLC
jgi:hypothetical protein